MNITFLDIDQVISRKGISGGENIDITIQIDGFDDFKLTHKKHNLMLNSVRNIVTETNKQVATLEFVSVESIINETARVNKKFTGNVSQTVSELLVSYKKGIQTKKKLDKHDATNSYSFIGNLKRPFDTVQWLCPKTQSSTKNFGFLFYENFDGYHFKSIEKFNSETNRKHLKIRNGSFSKFFSEHVLSKETSRSLMPFKGSNKDLLSNKKAIELIEKSLEHKSPSIVGETCLAISI